MSKLRRAFTITELVIVIAVIAILAAVLIPTFASVIDNAKKSHDDELVKEINIALSAYNAENGKNPSGYEELMLYLSEYGLTDTSNPFLLAEGLQQDNVYLVWYQDANAVVLVPTNSSDYVMTFTSSIGLGNGVNVLDAKGNSTQLGYALCTYGQNDYVAGIYRDFYIASGGSIVDFGGYTAETIKNNIKDQAWANSIIASLNNQRLGYTHSATIENTIENQLKTSNTVDIKVNSISGSESTKPEDVQAAKKQAVLSTMATLATMANSGDAATLANKTVKLSDVDDVVVDMTDVKTTAIGLTYRKHITNSASSFSTDFGGLTLENYNVPKDTFSSSGAEWQDAGDNGYSGAAYCYSYGLFGSVYAKPGETVKISNLTINNVNVNLNGSTETIGGQKIATITDQAALICGFAQGNVTFENITINGQQENGKNGSFSGYDGVAAILGRGYGNAGQHEKIVFNNCSVSNLDINGQRRASVFVSYFGNNGITAEMTNCKAENVNVTVDRDNMNEYQKEDDDGQRYTGALAHLGAGATIKMNGVVLTNVTTTVMYRGNPIHGITSGGSVVGLKETAQAATGNYKDDKGNTITSVAGTSLKSYAYVTYGANADKADLLLVCNDGGKDKYIITEGAGLTVDGMSITATHSDGEVQGKLN